MPRVPRLELPDGPAHLGSRGNRRERIFLDEIDYAWFLADLETATQRFDWTCMSYALLPNHFHLVVNAQRDALSSGFHWLNGRHARRFNHRHGYVGHLFQERFWAKALEDDAHLLNSLGYVAVNTWRAGLCEHPLACRRSSQRGILELDPPRRFLAVGRVLELFSGDQARARQLYAAHVETAMAEAAVSR